MTPERVKVHYTLKCMECGNVEITNQKRPDLALERHTRETHHGVTLVGIPVTSEHDREPASAD